MKVYVAASFAYADRAKTEERKRQIEEIINKIREKLPAEYYLPHQLTIPNAWDMPLEQWCQKVYAEDVKALINANVVLFLSFGKENNAGAVWEVGYAAARKYFSRYPGAYTSRPDVICIKMTNEPESLMVTQSVDAIITSEEIDTYDWEGLPAFRTQLNKIS